MIENALVAFRWLVVATTTATAVTAPTATKWKTWAPRADRPTDRSIDLPNGLGFGKILLVLFLFS
jgi:hypothetical protein